ncbi:MAG: sulfonate ABC transporter permease, partial [Nitrosomonas sp.]|nr:sulfonate ABC transporter permease [Nitrosomonas sp.]
MNKQHGLAAKLSHRFSALFWDLVAILLVLGLIVFLAQASRGLMQPLTAPGETAISLDASALPEYALRTSLRMLAAMILS